jgi:hypothetical protein
VSCLASNLNTKKRARESSLAVDDLIETGVVGQPPQKLHERVNHKYPTQCVLAGCTVEHCTHCKCDGECGREHMLGECGNDRYRKMSTCNPCNNGRSYLNKKKRARESSLAVDDLIETGVVGQPPQKLHGRVNHEYPTRCALAGCTVKHCTHCKCDAECGREHMLGECGNDRYRNLSTCTPCKNSRSYLNKKKRAREASLQPSVYFVLSGIVLSYFGLSRLLFVLSRLILVSLYLVISDHFLSYLVLILS